MKEANSSFLKEATNELKKVQPPTRQEALRATIVVLVMLFFLASCLGIIDLVIGRVVSSVMG